MKKENFNKYSGFKKVFCYVLVLSIIVPFNFIIANSVDAHHNENGAAISPSFYVHTERIKVVDKSSVTITWHTNKPSTSRIVYGLSPVEKLGSWPNLGYVNSTELNEDFSTFHSVVISGLDFNTKYYFRAVSSNAFGKELSFITVDSGTKNNSDSIVKDVTDDAYEDLMCVDMDGDGYFNKASDPGCGDIDCDDSFSNVGTCLDDVVINSYNTPHPVFYTHNEKVEVENKVANVTWHTNKPSTSRIVYGLSPVKKLGPWPNLGYTNSTNKNLDKKTFHKILIDGLDGGSTYYFRVVSGASPEVFSDEFSIAIDSVGDNLDDADYVEYSSDSSNDAGNVSNKENDVVDDVGVVGDAGDDIGYVDNVKMAYTSVGGSQVGDDIGVDVAEDASDDNDEISDEPGDYLCGLDECEDNDAVGINNSADNIDNNGGLMDWIWFVFLILLVSIYYLYEKYWVKNIDNNSKSVDSGMVDKLSGDGSGNSSFKQNYKDLKDDDR